MTARWQYPGKVEPVTPDGGVVALEKWKGMYQEPFRRKPFEYLKPAFFFYPDPISAPAEDITLDKWKGFYQEPFKRRVTDHLKPSFFFYPEPIADATESITLDKWFQVQQIIRARAGRPRGGLTEPPSRSSLESEVSTYRFEPVTPAKRLSAKIRRPPGGLFERITFPDINLDQWLGYVFGPWKRKRRDELRSLTYLRVDDAAPVATLGSFEARAVQKIIAILKTVSEVTAFTGTGSSARIYGAFPQTIADYVLPTVAIRILPSPGRMVTSGFMETARIGIEVWMSGGGANAYTWDDAVACYGAVIDALHRTSLWDLVVGIEVNEMTNTGCGGQVQRADGMMVLSSEWYISGDIV